MPRRRSYGEPHAELARPRAHREREHAGDADDGDQQRDASEAGEDERVHPIRRQHLGADVLECRGALDGLVGGELVNRAPHGRHERVRIAGRAHEQPPGDADLPDRLIDRHRRTAHDALVVHIRDDGVHP